jgi:hypothetical protein
MTEEMRALSDAEVDLVAGGGAGFVVAAFALGVAVGVCCGGALGIGSTVAGGAARRASEGDDQQQEGTDTGNQDTGQNPPE